MTNDTPIRAAIVGTGLIAKVGHLPAVQALDGEIELVAAVDVDKQALDAFADEAKITARYSDLTSMLAAVAPDLVIIATPPSLHRDQVVEALEAGCWVWCEKPPALTLADYDVMCRAETAGGPYLASVYQLRFGPGAQHYRKLFQQGELGRPLAAMCQTTWFRDDDYFAPEWRGNFSGDGGPAMALGIHRMDLMLAMLGPWREVSAFAATTTRSIPTDDVDTAIVRFENGALATVITSVVSPDMVSRLRIDAENATVELSHLYRYSNSDWTCTPAPDIPPETVKRWTNDRDDNETGHTSQLRELIADLRSGRRPETSGEGGRAVLELITALYKSAFTGQVVKRGEIDSGDPFYTALDGNAL